MTLRLEFTRAWFRSGYLLTPERTANLLIAVRVTEQFGAVERAALLPMPSRQAYCWGGTGAGFLGIPPTPNGVILSPNAVPGGLTFKSLGTSAAGACGVTTSDALYCWGDLVPPFQAPATAPTAVTGGPVLATLVLGASSRFGCGLTAAGAAYCWGPNANGQLGNGTVGAPSASPAAVAGGLAFAKLAVGGGFGCGLTATGAVYCWGASGGNQVGFGGNAFVPSPVFAAP